MQFKKSYKFYKNTKRFLTIEDKLSIIRILGVLVTGMKDWELNRLPNKCMVFKVPKNRFEIFKDIFAFYENK